MPLEVSNLMLYARTAGHLKFRQLLFRLYYRLRPHMRSLKVPHALSQPHKQWSQAIPKLPSHTVPSSFTFLNKTVHFSSANLWNDTQQEKLWLYNLHYFDFLLSSDPAQHADHYNPLIQRWIQENPFNTGVGWEPYPLSLRIVNWCKWALQNEIKDNIFLESLHTQAYVLSRKLEYHILANHLFANAKALIFAGLFFDSDHASKWLKKGLSLFNKQRYEQILPDGGHFERSPMYHAIILEDILDIIQLFGCYAKEPPAEAIAQTQKMLTWLSTMTHPDDEIAFFNDAATGIAPTFDQLTEYALQLKVPSTDSVRPACTPLPQTGYFRLENEDAVVIADAAPIKPAYQPGHAHADTLTFELSLFGKRLIVNSGTSCYGNSAERLRQRGTAAHNTIVIDETHSSEVWSAFRVARRAKIKALAHPADEAPITLVASHTGYHHLRGKPTHCRQWALGVGSLLITDTLSGRAMHAVEQRLHIHPDFHPEKIDDHTFALLDKGAHEIARITLDPQLAAKIISTTYHPAFGIIVHNHALSGCAKKELPIVLKTRITWTSRTDPKICTYY